MSLRQPLLAVSFFVIAALTFALIPQVARADDGDLISDNVFNNENSMTETQISAFINSFPSSCLKPSNYPSGLSPKTLYEPNSYFDYGTTQVAPSRIIYKMSKFFHVNPQVILTTLEKEQNLVSGSSGCAVWQYSSAMGYNCPDNLTFHDYPSLSITHTCVEHESNAGFARQVSHAAWQLRFDAERAYGNTDWGGDGSITYGGRMTQGNRARVSGGTVNYYDGYTVIDGRSIKLANGATAALYNYTPHFNSFATIFTRWFGATHSIPIPGCTEATNTSISCVWRARDNEHDAEVITTDYATINNYVNGRGYSYLGKSFFARNKIAPSTGNIPVYAVTMSSDETFITSNPAEYNTLTAANSGNTANGVMFYADPAGGNSGYPVYRLYNPSTSRHVWTSSAADIATYKSNGYVNDEGVAFNSLSTVRQETAPPAGQNLVYRFGNMPGNTHFWTTDLYERDSMIKRGYRYEGVAMRSSQASTTVPVYRLYSPKIKRHLYTKDAYEVEKLVASKDWQSEGTAWFAATSGVPVYRLYSPITFSHLYTASQNERDTLVRQGTFRSEGTAWYQP